MPINIGAMVGLASVAFVVALRPIRIFYAWRATAFCRRCSPPCIRASARPIAARSSPASLRRCSRPLFPLDILADLVSIGTLLAFVAVCAGIMILRRTAPRARRPFRTPFVWFVAPAGIAICGLMMFSLSDGTWVRLVLWTAIGSSIYFGYGVWHAAPSKWKVVNETDSCHGLPLAARLHRQARGGGRAGAGAASRSPPCWR